MMLISSCISCQQSLAPAFTWKEVFTFSIFRSDPLLPREQWLCAHCLAEAVFLGEGEICQHCSRSVAELEPEYRVQTEQGTICYDCQRWLEWEDERELGPVLVRNMSVIQYNDWAQETIARYKFNKDERLKYFLASLLWEHTQQAHLFVKQQDRREDQQQVSLAFEDPGLQKNSDIRLNRTCFPPLETFDIIIPIPSSSERLYERGFNQAGHLAQLLAHKSSIPCEESVLMRVDEEERQSHKSRAARLQEMLQKYLKHPRCPVDINGKRILLIDDIYTTGATVRAAAYRLMKEGAESVYSYTVAR